MIMIIILNKIIQMKNPKYTLRSIYDDNKKSLRLVNRKKKQIPYSSFKKVIYTYFKLSFENLFKFGDQTDIRTPLISGSFSIRKKIQTRSYHVLKDNVESKIQGKLVKYKVPILEDWYSVLIWNKKNPTFGKLRVVFSSIQNNKKKLFVKEKGWDNIITKN